MRRQKGLDDDSLSVVNETKPLVNGRHEDSGSPSHAHDYGQSPLKNIK